MEQLIVLGITAAIMCFSIAFWWFTEKPTEKKEYDECAECHHLIAKGSGQLVVSEYGSIKYCELHRKPYDQIVPTGNFGSSYKPIYYKKIDPWKRVNEDGTDYVERTQGIEQSARAFPPKRKRGRPRKITN